MADGGVGVAALALAVPALIEGMIRYGEFIHAKIQTFKNAKGIWADLGTFGLSLCQGQLKVLTETAKSFYLAEGCDAALKSLLESLIQRMHSDVEELKLYLEHLDPATLRARAAIAVVGERRARNYEKRLKEHRQELEQALAIQQMHEQRVGKEVTLTEQRLKVHEDTGYTAVPGASTLFTAKCSYREKDLEGQWMDKLVFIERDVAPGASEDALKDIATLLRSRLSGGEAGVDVAAAVTTPTSSAVGPKGVLQCLGYRMQTQQELVFLMPQHIEPPRTLQSLIIADGGVARHPLNNRFVLARQLAEAVLRVNGASLVHKNIRPATVLLVAPKARGPDATPSDGSGFGDLYLTNWCLLRLALDGTKMAGSSQWVEDIYRHPKRQGIVVQERYNIGHDVYSLGVCLLEIGLWSSLIVPAPPGGRPQVSQLLRAAATTQEGQAGDNEALQKLKRPSEIKAMLLKLAEEQLPPRMGRDYGRLVVACLTGLDDPSGFGEGVKFDQMEAVEARVAFKELVLGFFTDLSL